MSDMISLNLGKQVTISPKQYKTETYCNGRLTEIMNYVAYRMAPLYHTNDRK